MSREGSLAGSIANAHAGETLALAEAAAHLGTWHHDYVTGSYGWSDQLYEICARTDRETPPTPGLLLGYVHEHDRLALEAAIEFARDERRPFAVDTRLVGDDGIERWVQHRGHFAYSGRRTIRALGTVQDVTQRKRAEERLAYRVNYDELTGLPNRKLLADRLQQAVLQANHSGSTVAVLYVDLDRFKSINDTLGHEVGNAFLRVVTPRLVEAVRDTDTVARSGGDEFIAVLSGLTSIGEAARIAERVVESFAKPVTVGDRELYSSASVGIAVFPDDGETPGDLIRSAEAALYRAKERGYGSFRFYSTVTHGRAVDRLELEHALRRGFERDEFALHYQPLVDRSGRLVAVEALLRWSDPKLGAIGPDEFVPLCEEIGLIVPLGRWVIKTALEQLAAWNALGGARLRMALNISGRQVLDPTLASFLRDVVLETGVGFEQVELEMTESVVMGDVAGARSMIAELRALGASVSFDDFGTGYSSLSYLKHFDVDALKIDRTFVRDLPHDRGDAAIVTAVVALGHAMGLRVVAEGVETAEQMAMVTRLGCDEMQGFHFSRPLPPEKLERFLREASGVGKRS